MKHLYTAGFAGVLMMAAAFGAQAQGEVAAKVNGVAISASKVDRSTEAYLREKNVDVAAARSGAQYSALKEQVLEVLIGQELLWQDAQDKGMVAADDQVAAALEAVRGQYPSADAFNERLSSNGLTEQEFADDLKRRLSVRRLIAEDIGKKLEVSDTEVQEFYATETESLTRPEEVHLRHVLIKVTEDMDDEAKGLAKGKIEAVLEKAEGGADFAELAMEHSEGPTGPKGGDLGFVRKGQLVPPFENAAFALEPGDISGVVQTRFGYHIIKMEERRGGGKVELSEVSDKIRAHLLNQKGQQALRQRVDDLRSSAEVKTSGL